MTPESLVKITRTLFSLPDVVKRINELIDNPATQVSDLAEVILCDPALSARLLRLVNSAYYGRPHRVDSIPQAILLVGERGLRDLILATAAVTLFKGLPPEQVNMDLFWFRSIACGIAARLLARRKHLYEGERLFIAGLLHNIGRLIFYSQCPDLYREALGRVERGECEIAIAERQVFGFTYADLSAELLKAWRLPEPLRIAVAYHLKPAKAPNYPLEAKIIHVAARITCDLQIDAEFVATIEYSHEMLEEFSSLLSLPVATLVALPEEINRQGHEVFQIVRSGKAPIC
ncbi:HDOD domain-containing protein [Candidatus Contendibacter odensensis]|uniref:Signal transduction protein n=1 Tax=Candidatus Contendobacter odensis Run_B_J11 TaxID=1400861 RepID=A0A7U7J5H8_9GAMM|nr:HDOD domain-containing protein [Candidatus Contendobacter odensis]MBK8751409.1 HDOD domain-containing protein [Candidatus Competibacteraceae bacterium]CDH47315.1 putative signal transduction protein [Candidatus Contendobacter odensis Run_B_J11]